jgi:hypothetical protein
MCRKVWWCLESVYLLKIGLECEADVCDIKCVLMYFCKSFDSNNFLIWEILNDVVLKTNFGM